MSIYKRQSDDVKTFESAQDFLKYYENNQKELDSIHTRSLNLKFKIKDHHIGRKQNKLILYPTKQSVDIETDITNDTEDLNIKINKLKDIIVQLIERVNYLEQRLNIK